MMCRPSRRRRSSGNKAACSLQPVACSCFFLDPFFLKQSHEFSGLFQSEKPIRNIGLLGELGNLAENRQVLIRDFERRSDDQEKEVDRFLVDRLEVESTRFATKSYAQLVDDQRAAVRNRYSTANASGAEVFAPLEH